GDDFAPRYVSGDVDSDGLLDLDEVWLFTSVGATLLTTGMPLPSLTAQPGLYTNSGRVQATTVGGTSPQTVTATDPANYFGSSSSLTIVKAINATDPWNPSAIEAADAAPGPAFVN